MRKFLVIALASLSLTQVVPPAAAQNPSTYLLYRSGGNTSWSAFTNQAQCERSPHGGNRQCVSHIFCGTTYWFPRTSFDGKEGFSTSSAVSIRERASQRDVCKLR